MSNLIQDRLTAIAIGIFVLNAISIDPASAAGLDIMLNSPMDVFRQGVVSAEGGLDIGLQPIVAKDDRNGNPQKLDTATNSQKLGLGLTARISTLGIGVDVTKTVTDRVNGRLGFNFGKLDINRTDSGINYDSQLNLSSVQLLGDYYPFSRSNFRLTGGLVAQNNRYTVTSKPNPNGTYTIDNNQYQASDVGTLGGEFKSANSIAPYVGIGIGQPANEGFGFNADVGLMFAGSPQVSLTASNPAFNNNPITRNQIDNQARQTENNLKGFNLYPVISVGVSYGF